MKSILTFLGISLFPFFPMAEALTQNEDLNLTAPDGSPVTIERDTFGVTHISSETEVGVFFGQGYAAAQDRLSELQQKGQIQFDQDSPINDPGAPTTIQATGSSSPSSWRYSGMRIPSSVVDVLNDRRIALLLLSLHLKTQPLVIVKIFTIMRPLLNRCRTFCCTSIKRW